MCFSLHTHDQASGRVPDVIADMSAGAAAGAVHPTAAAAAAAAACQFAEDKAKAQELWDLAVELTGVDTADNLRA